MKKLINHTISCLNIDYYKYEINKNERKKTNHFNFSYFFFLLTSQLKKLIEAIIATVINPNAVGFASFIDSNNGNVCIVNIAAPRYTKRLNFASILFSNFDSKESILKSNLISRDFKSCFVATSPSDPSIASNCALACSLLKPFATSLSYMFKVTICDILNPLSHLFSIFCIPQVFKTCKSTLLFQSKPITAICNVTINPPIMFIVFWLAKSSFNSFIHSVVLVIKEFSKIFVRCLACFSSKPAALYSSYTFNVSICDIPKLLIKNYVDFSSLTSISKNWFIDFSKSLIKSSRLISIYVTKKYPVKNKKIKQNNICNPMFSSLCPKSFLRKLTYKFFASLYISIFNRNVNVNTFFPIFIKGYAHGY